ncbi:MAG: hypothetical protein Q4P07_06790 [Ornithinimicrobium sp.]|uniref:hypothetical protein n=1 Tax=Ornithinimicrobium sp. TaxID=1977084 RepID=UPI0026DF786E|nr:hypothetical protein [Ornithinimicrobium sp.]MDO5739839.1 hypothetical protein [Ornithinimicrobium sp.]
MLTPFAAPMPLAATEAWTGGDWTLYVVLPLVLLVAGVVLYLLGRRDHAEATKLLAGFGGPPGSLDVGAQVGFGVENNRATVLAAQRKMLWGAILGGVGLIWLVVSLIIALV